MSMYASAVNMDGSAYTALTYKLPSTPVDVRRFGAIGDGVRSDTAALVSAFGSGEELEFPNGLTFLLETLLTTTAQHLSIKGKGKILLAPGSNCGIIKLNAGQYGAIREVELDGNGTHQSSGGPLLYVSNGAYARLGWLHVHDSKAGGILFENLNGSALADEFNLWQSFVFSNGTYGVKVDYSGTPIQGAGDFFIEGNHINYNGTYGVHIHGGAAGTVSHNNVLTNGSHGIYAEGTPSQSFVTRLIVDGNQARNNGGSGLFAFAQNTSNGGAGLIVKGNQFHYNNGANTGSSNLDVWDTDYPIIIGNFCGDTDFTPRAALGLQISRTTNAVIVGNTLVNNAGGNFAAANGSTYIARGNYGLADNIAASDVTTGTFATARIPNLDAAIINTGTFGVARIPSLDVAKITTGTFATSFIPSLDASKVTTGVFALGRLATGTPTGAKFLRDDSTLAVPAYPVTSVLGRTGAVAAVSGDYTAAQVTNALDTSTVRSANAIFAGPTSGGSAAPTFRPLVAADVPATAGSLPLTVKTADYTATTSDCVILVDSLTPASAINITLPTATGVAGRLYTVKDYKGAAVGWTITILTTSSQTIDFASSKTINTAYGSLTFISDGTSNWSVI